jgi:CheY-like chemotaxis protein
MAHVLFIEPDTILARTYMQALQHAGHTTAHAHGAQQAIHAADEQTPHVAVLELQLTVHDGVEFLHEFRSYPEWQHIPVIVNTTLPPQSLEPVRQALMQDFGVTECLYKPRTTLQQLISVVNAQLASQTSQT